MIFRVQKPALSHVFWILVLQAVCVCFTVYFSCQLRGVSDMAVPVYYNLGLIFLFSSLYIELEFKNVNPLFTK